MRKKGRWSAETSIGPPHARSTRTPTRPGSRRRSPASARTAVGPELQPLDLGGQRQFPLQLGEPGPGLHRVHRRLGGGRRAAAAEAGLRRLLPGLAGARVERAWGGPIDVSADHLPFFRTKPGTRIHYGAGYSGHGVGPSWLGGKILASLALGADDEWTALPLATRGVPKLPGEPFRRLGGGLVRHSIMACEAAEEQGRKGPLHARAGAAIPRLLGMEIGTR